MDVRHRVRRLAVSVAYGGLRASGATAMRRRWPRTAPILCYHNVVAGSRHPAGAADLHMPYSRFEEQIRRLAARYDVVPVRELVTAGSRRRGGRPRAAITFDDAYVGVFEHAIPVLRRLGIPATIFAVAAPDHAGFWWDQPRVVAAMTPQRRRRWLEELRGDAAAILSDVGAPGFETVPRTHQPADAATIAAGAGGGIEIGVHSATHRSLPGLTDAELEQEVVNSRRALEEATGLPADLFAYPYGWCDPHVAGVVARAGYVAAFGLGSSRAGAMDRWCVGRINVPAALTLPAFEAWAAGFCPP